MRVNHDAGSAAAVLGGDSASVYLPQVSQPGAATPLLARITRACLSGLSRRQPPTDAQSRNDRVAWGTAKLRQFVSAVSVKADAHA